MYSLSTFCCVCLHDGEELQSLNDNDFDSIQLMSKLQFCALQTEECIINDAAIYICIQCCHILRLAYNFKKMCIKNNKFIRGYVSQLKSTSSKTNETNITLQKLKDYVDNIPLAQYITTKEKNTNRKKSPIKETTPSPIKETTPEKQILIISETSDDESLENYEPEINIHETDEPIINKTQIEIQLNPLTQNNDFQEKSSTETLDLLKNLVHGTQSVAIDKLRELITKPIPDESNDEFQFLEKYKEKENQQTTTTKTSTNDFDMTYVKPEPTDKLETENCETEEIQNLLNRDDNYCPICRKTFLCKSYYERHITMHTGIKNYECNICNKRFTRKSTLKTHFLVHTGDASFTCPLCDKIFTQKGNMKSHMQTHYSIESYRCYVCGKNFRLKHNFKAHLILHDNGKRQQCPICRKYMTKGNFAAHLSMHPEFRIIT